MKVSSILASIAAFFVSSVGLAQSAAVDVTLKPAGSFKATTTHVSGAAYKTSDGVAAENVIVKLTTLDSGISLRDKHIYKHLQTNKYPVAKLVKATGKNGQGKAVIEIAGKPRQVSGTYKVDGSTLKAQFKMKLSDLNIKNIRYMGVGVQDEVTIAVDLPIRSGPARSAASVKSR